MMTSCLALFLHLLHEKIQALITFQQYHVTQRLVRHNSVGSKNQKYKTKTKAERSSPRPRPVWDWSCHKTAVSDPKTASRSEPPRRHATPILRRRKSWGTRLLHSSPH